MKRKFVLGLALAVGLSVTPTFAADADHSAGVRAAQEALKDKGFNPGPIDGIEGPKTDAAVRKYQQANNLVVDGRLNAQVMNSLGLHQYTAGGEFAQAGSTLDKGYTKGAKDMAKGGEKLGKDVKTGEYANAPVDFGKDVGKGAEKMGKATGKAAVDTFKGVKKAVTPK